jgi:hypothetical protein
VILVSRRDGEEMPTESRPPGIRTGTDIGTDTGTDTGDPDST